MVFVEVSQLLTSVSVQSSPAKSAKYGLASVTQPQLGHSAALGHGTLFEKQFASLVQVSPSVPWLDCGKQEDVQNLDGSGPERKWVILKVN